MKKSWFIEWSGEGEARDPALRSWVAIALLGVVGVLAWVGVRVLP